MIIIEILVAAIKNTLYIYAIHLCVDGKIAKFDHMRAVFGLLFLKVIILLIIYYCYGNAVSSSYMLLCI